MVGSMGKCRGYIVGSTVEREGVWSRSEVGCEGKGRPANEDMSAGVSLKLLNLIKWRDESGQEQKFRLVNRVSSRWESFGYRLDLPQNMLDAWREECHHISAHCWCKVMHHWLTGGDTPDYPATWDGLFEILEDTEYFEVARQLKEAVLAAKVSDHISSWTRDGECCSQLHVGIYSCSVCASLLSVTRYD